MCGLSLIYQVLLVITCHFKLKKAYGIAIHTQNFRKKKLSKSLLYHILVSLRNRTGEERRRKTLCDKRDNNFN